MQLENDNICSVPEFTGVAIRLGKKISDVIIGCLYDDNDAQKEIAKWCDIAKVLHDLKGARMGLMGHTMEAMYDMHADPTAISAAFGLHVPLLEVDDVIDVYNTVTEEEIQAKISVIDEEFDMPEPKSDPITSKLTDADKYQAGDREITDTITNLNLDYLSGTVTVKSGDTDKITITETANRDLTEDQKVHTWVNGDTLYVRFCASSKNIDFTNIEKKLIITFPEDQEFDNATIDLTSGELTYTGIKADTIKSDITSGKVDITAEAGDVSVDATSGDVFLNLTGDSGRIDINTTSGDINADIGDAESLEIDVTSGPINVTANSIRSINVSKTSGDIEFRLNETPDSVDIDSTSGKTTFYLPEDADITADIDTTSGEFNYNLPFTRNDGVYVSGNGASTFSINATSGDVTINKI